MPFSILYGGSLATFTHDHTHPNIFITTILARITLMKPKIVRVKAKLPTWRSDHLSTSSPFIFIIIPHPI